MPSNKRRILICGASGFIGRNVAEALGRRTDCEVIGTFHSSIDPVIPGVRSICADLRDGGEVSRLLEGVDTVVQAAAVTSGAKDIVTHPHIHVTDNAVMNSLIFRAAHEKKVRQLVFFSCSVMYPPDLGRPARESDFDASIIHSSYFGVGWTKVYLEKMAEFYSRLGATRYTVIRHSNIYGPHDKYDLERSHVFGATVTKVMTSLDGKLRIWGDGSEKRDLLHVSDLVRFVETAIERQHAPFDLVNVGSGQGVSIRELAERVISASGRPLQIETDPTKPTIKTSVTLDCSRAREQFGWEPSLSLDQGIRDTLDWYRGRIPEGGVTLFVPVLNEIDGLRALMPKIPRELFSQVLIVDGGSTDGSAEWARSAGYEVMVQKRKGLRHAYSEGWPHIRGRYVLSFSPDGNCRTEEIPALLAKLKEGFDMVIASRYLGLESEDDDRITWIGNQFFTRMVNLLFGGRYTDVMTIFRAYRTELFPKLDLHQDASYWPEPYFATVVGIEPLLSTRAAKAGLRVAEIPSLEPRRAYGIRKLQIVRWGAVHLFQILRELIYWRSPPGLSERIIRSRNVNSGSSDSL